MKKKTMWTMVTLAAMLLVGCAPGQSRIKSIDAATAKAAALEAAGLTEQEAVFDGAVLGERNGLEYYEVAFTANGQRYDCDVDALTGKVIEYDGPKQSVVTVPVVPETTAADVAAENAPVETTAAPVVAPTVAPEKPATANTATNEKIGKDRAKELAIAHAGISESQVTFIKCGLDWEDGRQVYDVEFYGKDYMEYDYDVDALTGEIVSFDHDAEYYQAPAKEPSGQGTAEAGNAGQGTTSKGISADKAKQLALAQVPGAAASDIREFEVDYDDGRLEYEGTIYYGGMEYEFEIDGYSGAIRSWDVEPIGD